MLIAARVCSSALQSTVMTIRASLSAIAVSHMYILPTELQSTHLHSFPALSARL